MNVANGSSKYSRKVNPICIFGNPEQENDYDITLARRERLCMFSLLLLDSLRSTFFFFCVDLGGFCFAVLMRGASVVASASSSLSTNCPWSSGSCCSWSSSGKSSSSSSSSGLLFALRVEDVDAFLFGSTFLRLGGIFIGKMVFHPDWSKFI